MHDHDNIEDKTLFMLINCASRMFHNAMRAECEKSGISKSFQPMFFHLRKNPGLSQHELVRLTNLTPPTVSVTLQKMESEGLIVRKSDEYDERRMRIYITEKGIMTDDKIRAAAHCIECGMTKNLSEDEILSIRAGLIKLLKYQQKG